MPPRQDPCGQPIAGTPDLGPGDGLRGMWQIEAYSGYGRKLIARLVQEAGFPAHQIADARWESSKSMIDEWRKCQIQKACQVVSRGHNSASRGVTRLPTVS